MHRIIKKDIFISHSSNNAVIAEQLGAFLKNIGISSDRIFCSSVLGQGVNNGEKLNDAIFKAIKGAKIIIYILSQDFLNSSYCIEELGAGWYLSSDKQTYCYYLRLPDMELSELQGFVNSKIDKFSLINCSEDLILLVENICHTLKIKVPKLTEITSNVRSFLSSIIIECERCIEGKSKTESLENERLHRVERLESELAQKVKQIEDLENKLQKEQERKATEKLKDELEFIDKYFRGLTSTGCISTTNIKNINDKGYWYRLVNQYTELINELGAEPVSYEIERLIAQIYIAYKEFNNAYIHFKKAIQKAEYVPFFHIKDFANEYPFSLSEIILLLEEKIQTLKDVNAKDMTINCKCELEKRETKIIEATK